MKYSINKLFLIVFLLGSILVHGLSAEDSTEAELELILVEASNSNKGIAGSLRPYSENLKRIFNFDTFKQAGKSTLTFNTPSTQKAQLNGQTVKVDMKGVRSGEFDAELNWSDGKRTMLKTRLKLKKTVPAVLGGPKTKNGEATYLIILQWKR